MISTRKTPLGLALLIASTLLAFACSKKSPPPPPPAATNTTPPPPAPAPTITLRAEPSTIDRGGAAMLQWEARNAASVTITPEVGNVALTGNRSVSPTSSVSYQATATGPGGTATDVARVTVNIPPAAPAAAETPRRPDVSASDLFRQNMGDIHFEYDRSEINSENTPVLQKNAAWLKQNPNVRFTIEGHCDERGSEEYNLGLGDRRANAVKEYLIAQGVAANRINTISYGEERPTCREQTEGCYSMNRRAHFELNP